MHPRTRQIFVLLFFKAESASRTQIFLLCLFLQMFRPDSFAIAQTPAGSFDLVPPVRGAPLVRYRQCSARNQRASCVSIPGNTVLQSQVYLYSRLSVSAQNIFSQSLYKNFISKPQILCLPTHHPGKCKGIPVRLFRKKAHFPPFIDILFTLLAA